MASVTLGFQNKLTLGSFKKSKSIELFSLSSLFTVNMLSSFMEAHLFYLWTHNYSQVTISMFSLQHPALFWSYLLRTIYHRTSRSPTLMTLMKAS